MVETIIEYCWQLIASIATAFCQLLWPYSSDINRLHAFSAQGWKIAAVALLLSIFLAWLTQGWWFWPLGPVILTG